MTKTSLQTFGLFVTLATVVACGPLMWSWSQRMAGDSSSGLEIGQPMPALSGAGWVNAEAPTANALRDKVVVVDAWFLACPYCHKGMPQLVSTWKKYRERGVVFVGLTFEPESSLDGVKLFMEKYEAGWPVAWGADECLAAFKAEYFPGYWVIGRDGKVLWNKSMADSESMEQAIERALTASPGRTAMAD